MTKKSIKWLFLMFSTVFFLVGCEQPKIFMNTEEAIKLQQEEELRKDAFENLSEKDLYKEDNKEYKLLQQESALNILRDEEMIKIGRSLMEKEVEIYSLPNNKKAFDKWVNETYMNPKENEFLRYYRELGSYKDVEISFSTKDLDGEKKKLERVSKLGKTGFFYHGLMTLEGVNKKNEQEEMAILNLILHIDKDPKTNEYKIVKMGGSTANTVIDIPDKK